ncbi:MAG: OmpA family protein [Muribaculaceae bacterium]|nr:OmpA family protein [Muribaculaceae bacterium]
MKKIILSAAIVLGTVAAQAQVSVQGSKFTDNWSATIKGGMTTPLKGHAFFGDARGVIGAEIRKQVTPVFGLGVEGNWMINTPHIENSYVFDHSYVGVFGTANLMNLFQGYQGTPRDFEVETVLGAGWLHGYVSEWNYVNGRYNGWDKNAFGVKAGLNFNYNFGKAKEWTVSLKPAIVWDLDRLYSSTESSKMNVNYANFELQAGVTYHFKNSNGTHHFAIVKPYDQAEVDGLNNQINKLRGELEACNANAAANAAAANAKISQLEAALNACMSRKPEVVKEVSNTLNSVRYVFFKQGKSNISADQLPNVEQIATYLKKHPEAKVSIKGYASPEGSAEVNAKIATARAEAVKNSLVKKYKIAADRISAEGQGVGEMFEEPDWNRVSICTLEEDKK